MANKIIASVGVNKEIHNLLRGPSASPVFSVMRKAYESALKWWYREVLPKHFEEGAATRYMGAYTRRAKGYLESKQKKWGHRKPMVWSGKMRAKILGGGTTPKDKATTRRYYIELKLPHAHVTNIWRGVHTQRGGRPHDFAHELTVTSKKEEAALGKRVERVMNRLLADKFERGGQAIKMKRVA